VDATFNVATGPNSQVTGASGIPMASTLVFDSRLNPPGWNSAVENHGFTPWAMAYAGHSRNHMNSAGSPQPQVAVADGWVDQTCHHSTTDSARYSPPPTTYGRARRGHGDRGAPSGVGSAAGAAATRPTSAVATPARPVRSPLHDRRPAARGTPLRRSPPRCRGGPPGCSRR